VLVWPDYCTMLGLKLVARKLLKVDCCVWLMTE